MPQASAQGANPGLIWLDRPDAQEQIAARAPALGLRDEEQENLRKFARDGYFITRIELSKDVRHAKVLFSCLGGQEEREKSQQALDRAAYFIHGLLKKRFHLKIIPKFERSPSRTFLAVEGTCNS